MTKTTVHLATNEPRKHLKVFPWLGDFGEADGKLTMSLETKQKTTVKWEGKSNDVTFTNNTRTSLLQFPESLAAFSFKIKETYRLTPQEVTGVSY